MTDKEMRCILIEYLAINNREFRIFQEKNIGSSICDLMLVTDRLCGFEIKSDSDNFERIGRQVAAYEQFFDENTLVVGGRYLHTAQEKVPESWGILCIERHGILKVRAARIVLQAEEEMARKRERDLLAVEEKIARERERLAAAERDERYARTLDLPAMKGEIARCARSAAEKLFGSPSQRVGALAEFEIYTPEKQSQANPYLRAVRAGASYSVPCGESAAGNAARFRHFLSGFGKIVRNIAEGLEKAEKNRELPAAQRNGESSAEEKIVRLEKETAAIFQKIQNGGA